MEIKRAYECTILNDFFQNHVGNLLVLVGSDKLEGTTTFLSGVVSSRETQDKFSLVSFHEHSFSNHPKPLACGLTSMLAQLVWLKDNRSLKEFQAVLKKLNICKDRKSLRSYVRQLKGYGKRCTEKYPGTKLPMPIDLDRVLSELRFDDIQDLFRPLVTAGRRVLVVANDIKLDVLEFSPLFESFLHAENSNLSCCLVLSTMVGSELQTTVEHFDKYSRIPTEYLRLDPVPRERLLDLRTLDFELCESPIDCPVIPGIAITDKQRELPSERLHELVISDNRYADIRVDTSGGNELALSLTSLLWVLGRIPSNSIDFVARILDCEPRKVLDSLIKQDYIVKINQYWQFVDGWRSYLFIKDNFFEVLERVHSLLCRFVTNILQNHEYMVRKRLGTMAKHFHNGTVPGTSIDTIMHLAPAVTNFMYEVLSLSVFHLQRKSSRPLIEINNAARILEVFGEFPEIGSLHRLQLLCAIFEVTQRLDVLDALLAELRVANIPDKNYDYFINLVSSIADKWHDVELLEGIFLNVAHNNNQNRLPESTIKRLWKLANMYGLISRIKDIIVSYAGDLIAANASFSEKAEYRRFCIRARLMEDTGMKAFIVHGHDSAPVDWLKNFIREELHWPKPIVLSEEPSAGSTIIEKFEEKAEEIDIVFVILTPDDPSIQQTQEEGELGRVRQNVVFELGYFFGHFGRRSGRVILLKKQGVNIPSDIQGLDFIELTKDFGQTHVKLLKAVKVILEGQSLPD